MDQNLDLQVENVVGEFKGELFQFFPTGSSGFFRGSVLGQNTSEPQPSTGETQEDMNNVSCRRDVTEILLKAA